MRCWGRTKVFSRCENKSGSKYYPFCGKHKWQIVILLLITIPTFIGLYSGIYRDVIDPLVNNDLELYEITNQKVDDGFLNVHDQIENESVSIKNKIEKISHFSDIKSSQQYKNLTEILNTIKDRMALLGKSTNDWKITISKISNGETKAELEPILEEQKSRLLALDLERSRQQKILEAFVNDVLKLAERLTTKEEDQSKRLLKVKKLFKAGKYNEIDQTNT